MIVIENNKILIDGVETKNATLIGFSLLDYAENNTGVIIFDDEQELS